MLPKPPKPCLQCPREQAADWLEAILDAYNKGESFNSMRGLMQRFIALAVEDALAKKEEQDARNRD